MAESTVVKNKRDGTLTFFDAADANDYEVSYETGDFNISVPKETVAVVLDRGKFLATPGLRKVDDQPVTFTFTSYMRDLTDVAVETIGDILNWSGYVAANWTPRNGANAERPMVKLQWDIEGTDHGDSTDKRMVIDYVDITSWTLSEGELSTFTVNGTGYVVKPTNT